MSWFIRLNVLLFNQMNFIFLLQEWHVCKDIVCKFHIMQWVKNMHLKYLRQSQSYVIIASALIRIWTRKGKSLKLKCSIMITKVMIFHCSHLDGLLRSNTQLIDGWRLRKSFVSMQVQFVQRDHFIQWSLN